MNQLCKVCGEPAAGYHFGAFTCEGCKSFFGRTYNNPNSIGDCKNNNQCVINKKNRTSCKSCRLKKCIQVGMSKTGSRYGRRSNWFKLHCLIENPTTSLTSNTNGSSIQLNESFNENKDLVNLIKSEAISRENHVKNSNTNGMNNNSNNNNNNNNNNNHSVNNNNNKSNINKNSSTNNSNLSHNGNCNSNHTLHNITNHSNVVLTANGNKSSTHVSPGTHNSSSDGPSPLLTSGSEGSTGRINHHLPSSYSFIEAAAKALGFSSFDPTNSFMLHPHSDSKAGLKFAAAAAAVAAAAQASSSKSSDQHQHHHHLNHHNHHQHHHPHPLHSHFLHPLNVSSSSSSSPPIVSGQTSQLNLSTTGIGSTITTPASNSSSPSITSNGRVATPNDNFTFPFNHHHHPHQLGSQSSHQSHQGIPISPIAPMSPLDPSSRHLFHSAVQLFGKGFNVLPKELNNYLLSSAYTNRLFPIGSINQVSKLTSSSSVSLSPSSHFINIKGAPPSPSDIIYGNNELTDQERPIDLSRSSVNIKPLNPHHSNKSKKQPRRATRGSEDEEDEEEDGEEEDEDTELCLHDDNNNPTNGDEGSKNCMIGDHDSGFSPSSNEENLVTTPLDLTAKKSPTPPPSAPPSMTIS